MRRRRRRSIRRGLRRRGGGRSLSSQEEEEEEEEEAFAEVLRATSSSFRNSHSEIWTLLYEPFVLAVSCSVSWCSWFNSGYSPCVSSQRLWISSLFSTCWTRILRSFLIFCILLRSLGIWQPLVHCLPCPGFSEKLDFLRDDFSHYFLRAPCIWQSLYCVWCCLWSFGLWIFREMTPGMVSVLNTPRFDSGYIFGVSLRSLLEEFPSYFNALLCSTANFSLCVRLRRLVLLVTMHLALYSFVVLRSQMLVITAGMDQKECYVSPCRKLRIFRSCSSSQSSSCRCAVAAVGPRDSPVA